MIEPIEKSTGLCLPTGPTTASCGIDGDLVFDGRLALHHRADGWLAVADLHFGYELSRRREGALWPLWGTDDIAARLAALLEDYQPRTLVLVGDVVDSSAAPAGALAWLRGLHREGLEVILIEGNHDRGACRREYQWRPGHRIGNTFFEHGHLPPSLAGGLRVRGHLHPSVSLGDGAGTRLRLPCLVLREDENGGREIVLPAFSPWAAGGRYTPPAGTRHLRQWAASPQRVFEIPD